MKTVPYTLYTTMPKIVAHSLSLDRVFSFSHGTLNPFQTRKETRSAVKIWSVRRVGMRIQYRDHGKENPGLVDNGENALANALLVRRCLSWFAEVVEVAHRRAFWERMWWGFFLEGSIAHAWFANEALSMAWGMTGALYERRRIAHYE